MFSRNRKTIRVLLFLAMLLPLSTMAGAGSAQAQRTDAISANQKGLAHFKQGFYDFAPRGRKGEARNEFTQAEKAFLRAIEIDEDFIEAHRNLARLYYIQGEFRQARAQYAQVLRLDPADVDTYVQMALVATELGNFQEATQYLEAAKQKTVDAEIIARLESYIQKIPPGDPDGEEQKGGER